MIGRLPLRPGRWTRRPQALRSDGPNTRSFGPSGPGGRSSRIRAGRYGATISRLAPIGIAFAGYLAVSIVLWWHAWSTHPTSVTICGCGDPALFLWFLEWPAHAIAHGSSLFHSTALFHPGGINLLSNTSVLAIGIPLAPVTWLFGPATRVYARTRNVFGYDVEDTAVCTIEHASGVVGTLISIFNGVRGREERRLEVFFERGAVEVTTDFLVGAREDSFLVQRPDQEPERLDVAALRERHFATAGIDRRDFLVYLYPAARAFVRSVRERQPASPTFSDALAAHALVDAAYRSVGNGAVEVQLSS